IHRDIKPENVMIREDGIVKILDFGVAKFVEKASFVDQLKTDDAPTAIKSPTQMGAIIGTPNYMSPEQARGREIDGRSDIFSLGGVLYEMLSGQQAFTGETAMDTIGAILHKEPPPLSASADLPDSVESLVERMMQKDRDKRYQTASELLADIKSVRRNISTRDDDLRNPTMSGRQESRTQVMEVVRTDAVPSVSSAEYIVRGVSKNRRGLLLLLIPFAVIIAGFIYFAALKTRPAVLTDKDTILLADIENSTGDAVFDGALKQGLAVTLGQSPFLDIFPDARVRQTLVLMERSENERINEQLAREICMRQGLKAFLTGSIASLGTHYVITLKAVNAQTGEEVAREQSEADGKESVLTALSQAATKLRSHLGESLSSIQKFDAPVEQATTGSLDALKAFSLGLEQANYGNYVKAIPFYQRSVELDPRFALGYQALAREQLNSGYNSEAILSATKAYELRDHASENEKLFITLIYHRVVTNDLEKAIEVGEVWKNTYPRFWRPYHSLADLYLDVGDFAAAVENGREASRLNPKVAATYSNLAGALMFMGRFDEAEQVYRQGFDNGLDAPEWHWYLYWIGYSRGNAEAMQQQIDWMENANYARWSSVIQAQAAALGGEWRKSKEIESRAVKLFGDRSMKGLIAWTSVRWAQTAAAFGDCASAKEYAAKTLQNSQDSTYSGTIAVLAQCGDTAQSEAIAKRLTQLYPTDTRLNGIWLPLGKAAAKYARGDAAGAVADLSAASRFEATGDFQIPYLRGLCYLRLGQGEAAAAEFRKIIDRRGQGEVLVASVYPLARLGLARAAVATGKMGEAKRLYEDFFTQWKNADTDLPILVEARKEAANLK
ncbi:MAG: protein kinase, partial [Acidobacteria bacterium]|nr:protein kinase [Acidobacteriota bacterium]